MPTKAYTFKQDKKTEEIHIYAGKILPAGANGKCTSNPISICEAKEKINGTNVRDAICLEEEEARYKAAEIGREVCGNCVKNLYATY